jgi:hypothetical protein
MGSDLRAGHKSFKWKPSGQIVLPGGILVRRCANSLVSSKRNFSPSSCQLMFKDSKTACALSTSVLSVRETAYIPAEQRISRMSSQVSASS